MAVREMSCGNMIEVHLDTYVKLRTSNPGWQRLFILLLSSAQVYYPLIEVCQLRKSAPARPVRYWEKAVMSEIGIPLVGFYDYRLVALSIFIAISASFMALDLGGRITAASGWSRSAWLAGGAAAMGLGIWSMHFTGMLAFNLPVPVYYDWPTVLLSLLAAFLASAVALYVVSRKKMGRTQAITGSALMGLGIAVMHYTGMAAMRLSAVCHFSLPIVVLSVLIAGIASLVAIQLTFYNREDFRETMLAKVISATVMGAAIFLMHYSGMWSASFLPTTVLPDLSHAVSVSSLGLSGIVIGTLVVQCVAMVTSSVDRRLAKQAQELQSSECFRQIADSLRDVLLLSSADLSEVLFVNRAYQAAWGRTVESLYANPRSWLEGVHPDNRQQVEEAMRKLVNGEPLDSLEFRVVRPDGFISWVRLRAQLICDSQNQSFRIVGSVHEFTMRKLAEEKVKQAHEELRRLSGQLLRSQDEERRRIARELHDLTGQNLVALSTMLGQISGSLPSADRKSRSLLAECMALAEQCIREVRTLSYVLHPPVLDEAGLEEAIRDYASGFTKRSGITVELELSTRLGRMERDIEVAIFRVVQESLTNIQRHSGSQGAKIRIDRNSNLTLEISDRGRGAPGNRPAGEQASTIEAGVGILSMQERVKLIGGQFEIDSSSRGTIVRVTVPLEMEKHEKAAHSDR
jgi:PAS domain S-box-containing protein